MNIVVFGAGISGLTAAHFLSKKGYKVDVYEILDKPGGLAQSAWHEGLPSEYSWRGFGPWYNNTFELMKDIGLDMSKKCSKISFSLLNDTGVAPLDDNKGSLKGYESGKGALLFPGSLQDLLSIGWNCGKAWTSNKRSEEVYSKINAYEMLKETVNPSLAQRIAWTFGPWVGVDASRASVHHTASFFRKNLFPGNLNTGILKKLSSDGKIPGWLVFNEPINDVWFDPWVKLMKQNGVNFHFNCGLKHLEWCATDRKITRAILTSGAEIKPDIYVLAMNPFITRDILHRNLPLMKSDPQLSKFDNLVADGPHTQISFRLAFGKKIKMCGTNAVILLDSEYNITIFFQDLAYDKNKVYLGKGVESLWSGTACISTNPGKLFNLPMINLTKEQFIQEVKYQIYKCQELNELVKLNNAGQSLESFPLLHLEIWHSWIFPDIGVTRLNDTLINEIVSPIDRLGITSKFPKWVNSTNTQAYQPECATSIKNLYLVGAHTKTSADLYSIEGAVESSRILSDILIGESKTIPQKLPTTLSVLRDIDDKLYEKNLPQVLNFCLLFLLIFIVIFLVIINPHRVKRSNIPDNYKYNKASIL